jgi:threonine dehydrogenase-like Zn-dependent dehydrogenase
MEIKFRAFDYHSDDTFNESEYEYCGDTENGWIIKRNDEIYLELGPGYKLLKTKQCGICSTDLARRYLPFPLPQIIGHEVVAYDIEKEQDCVVEINDTHFARNQKVSDAFCQYGLPTHCPERMVLGIDRLPGGFGPYILAPVNSVIPVGNVSSRAAVLLEPFAAALHAVTSSPPQNGDHVAILGTGKLGLLLLAALKVFRENTQTVFKITALSRHTSILKRAIGMGADEFINIQEVGYSSLKELFDLVFDTTGSPSGFETALLLAKREVHLKSTNGQEVCGLKNLTEFVVDELSLLPFSKKNLAFNWGNHERLNQWVYLSKGSQKISIPKEYQVFNKSYASAEKHLKTDCFQQGVPRYDLGVASTISEIDLNIRPNSSHENSLIRPRGAILFDGDHGENPLLRFISSGKTLRSSRCGDFRNALKLLEENEAVVKMMEEYMISHYFPYKELVKAYETAHQSNSVKVVINYE